MTLLAHHEKRIRDIPPDKTFFFLISIPIISLFLMLSLFFISENGNLPTFINCMISASAVLLLICNLLVYAADSYSKNGTSPSPSSRSSCKKSRMPRTITNCC